MQHRKKKFLLKNICFCFHNLRRKMSRFSVFVYQERKFESTNLSDFFSTYDLFSASNPRKEIKSHKIINCLKFLVSLLLQFTTVLLRSNVYAPWRNLVLTLSYLSWYLYYSVDSWSNEKVLIKNKGRRKKLRIFCGLNLIKLNKIKTVSILQNCKQIKSQTVMER